MIRGYKGNQTFSRVFEIFWCTMCSKHVCFHVRYRFQGFVFCGKPSGYYECNLVNLWIWCQSCISSFDGLLWLIKPYCQCIYMFNSWYFKWISKRKFVWCWSFNWNWRISISLVIGQLILFKKNFSLPFACVDPLAWWPISKCGPSCQTNLWNLKLVNKN